MKYKLSNQSSTVQRINEVLDLMEENGIEFRFNSPLTVYDNFTQQEYEIEGIEGESITELPPLEEIKLTYEKD